MRHRKSGRHLTRTSAHRIAMRRNLAQSLFEFGEIRTTIPKAKDVKPFVERLITLARRNTIQARQRVTSLLADRAIIPADQQESYEGMSDAQRHKVLFSRSGRRMRRGGVPAAYNKKKIPFVASSVIHKLFSDIAPRYRDRPGGYTRLIRLSTHRIGDNSQLAVLQLVGTEQAPAGSVRKAPISDRRKRQTAREAFAAGKNEPRAKAKPAATKKTKAAKPAADAPKGTNKGGAAS